MINLIEKPNIASNDEHYLINKVEDIEQGALKRASDIKLDNVFQFVEDYCYTNEIEYINELFEEDKDHRIYMSKGFIDIKELNAKVHEVIYCIRSNEDYINEEPVYEADYTGFMFFNSESNEFLYEEGYTSFEAALSNIFKRETNTLLCDIYI